MSYETFIKYAGVDSWFTVKDLLKILKECPPHAMISTLDGHCIMVYSVPNANEPYVYLGNNSKRQ